MSQPPDGYTLYLITGGANVISATDPQTPFNTLKDFSYVSTITLFPFALFVGANSPIKTFPDLLAAAKANPGKLNYGSAGVGSSQHLAAVQFIAATKVDIVHVPYKGTSPAEVDLIAGHISLMLDTTTCLPFIASGKLRALAVASKKRNPALPDVPTLDEAGVPGVYASSWYGLMAPAGTPRTIIDRLNAEANQVLQSPEIKRRMAEFGAEIGGGTPEEFGQFIVSEIKRYEPIVRLSGAKLE
jgi:tripartite-type tricarboxylate transporter receptor subunit TctC